MKVCCLFDLDGTLIDPKVGITKSVQYALSSFGIDVKDLDELKHFIGPPLYDSFRDLYGFNETEVEIAVRKYREYYSNEGIFECYLYDGINKMLSQLMKDNIMMAIATSKPTVFAEKIAGYIRIIDYFESIVGSELDGSRSRKSEIIDYALNIIDPKRNMYTIMVGDRKHDIIGAYETGVESIGVTWGYGSRVELELSNATRIADTPDELLQMITKKSVGESKWKKLSQ